MHYNVLRRSLNLARVLSGNTDLDKIKRSIVRKQSDKALATNTAAGNPDSGQSLPQYLLDLKSIDSQFIALASSFSTALVAWKPLESIDEQARKDLNAWLHARSFEVGSSFIWISPYACSVKGHNV